ncbi:hypothetical protein [Flavobacterium johnsoniae]|uniref:hypothetical protein n=1 Tax=unclassified Flavobacterium TaxID=196869 RepID=UPI000EB32261
MPERIIKDIRYYESNEENIVGKKLPGNLGTLFNTKKEPTYIGQRIARKLNELKLVYGEVDHIYINLTTVLNENQIVISERKIDERIRYFDYGVNAVKFNSLSDHAKNSFIQQLTFKILKHISGDENLKKVNETEELISKFGTEITIFYKTKETTAYKINLFYQIKPNNNPSRIVVEYINKKDSSTKQGYFDINFYEDIYSLVDTISVVGKEIILKPKKSFRANLYSQRYNTPIKFEIENLL